MMQLSNNIFCDLHTSRTRAGLYAMQVVQVHAGRKLDQKLCCIDVQLLKTNLSKPCIMARVQPHVLKRPPALHWHSHHADLLCFWSL